MAHVDQAFPYSVNEAGESYIFSALDCECTRTLFEIAEQDGTITAGYKAALIANLYTAAQDAPNNAFWSLV